MAYELNDNYKWWDSTISKWRIASDTTTSTVIGTNYPSGTNKVAYFGPVPVSVITADFLTAKGSLATFDTAPVELAVGTDGFVLTADSAEATGLKWSSNGVGDVIGPASAVAENITSFDGITGKIIKDSGITTANVSDAVSKKHTQNTDTQFNNGVTEVQVKALTDNPVYNNTWAPPIGGAILNLQSYSLNNNDNVNFGTSDFSIEYYGKLGAFVNSGSGWNVVFGKGNSFTAAGYALIIGPNANYIRFNVNSTYSTVYYEFQEDEIVYVYAERSGETSNFYVNNVLIATKTDSIIANTVTNTDVFTIANDITLGRYFKNNTYFARGNNRVLTSSERAERWNNGQPHLFVEPYATRNAVNQLHTAFTNDDFDTYTPNGTGGTFANTSGASVENSYSQINCKVGQTIKISFTSLLNSGSQPYARIATASSLSGFITNQAVVDGLNEIEVVATASPMYFGFLSSVVTNFTISDDVKVSTLGNTFSALPQDAGTNGWKCKIGGEISVMNSTASPIALGEPFDGHLITASTRTMTNTIFKGQILKYIKIKNLAVTLINVSLGTTGGGTDILSGVSIPASSEEVFPVLLHFSDSADTTLYFSSAGTTHNYQVRFVKENI